MRIRTRGAWPVAAGIRLGAVVFRLLMIPLVVAVSAILVAVGLFPAVGGAGAAVKKIDQTLLGDSDDLKIPEFPLRSTIYAADGTELATVAEYNRIFTPLENVNDPTRHAVLAIEDARFYEHGPVDPASIIRAAIDNLVSGEVVSGASTISQQLVKNTVTGTEVTFERKFKEAQAAIQLERTYTKDQILELYLNQVYLGRGTYGIGAAAEYYFATKASKLKLPEAALLAALIQRPADYDPIKNRPAAVARRNFVLQRMRSLDWISSDEYAEAVASPIKLSKKKRNVNTYGPQPYFVDYVRNQILHPIKDDPNRQAIIKAFGKTVEEREQTLYQGGLKIHTTLNLDYQNEAQASVNRKLKNPGPRPPKWDPTGSLVSIVPSTGAIVTMYGGKDFSKDQFNLATQAGRGAGSAFKAFTLAAAFEQGFPVGKVYKASSPVEIDPEKCPDPEGVWTPGNAEGGGGGYIPLTSATAGSVNVVFAQLIADIGPEHVAEVAERMGVRKYAWNANVNIPPVCSITLGSVEVSPLAMASGFSTLANEGVHCWPFAIRKVVAQGKTLFKSKPSCKRQLDQSVAAQVTSLLQGVTEFGTATIANLPGRPEAGKTGTGQDYKDVWFMGYIPQLVTGVWVGYTKKQYQLQGIELCGYGNCYGGTVAAPIWADFMVDAVKGMPVKGFPAPPAQKAGEVPDVVGMMEEQAIETLADATFTAIPKTVKSHEKAGTVVAQTPKGGATATLGSAVTISISDGKGDPPPKMKDVPDVQGLSEGDATATLEDAGFGVSVTYECTDDSAQDGIVFDQAPVGGSKAEEGSTVTIWVWKDEPDPCP